MTTWTYPCLIKSWIDGDTARVDLDVGCRMHWQGSARIIGINAPELRNEGGPEAKAFAEQIAPPGLVYIVTSEKLDSFGRPLISLQLQDGYSFSETMLHNGYAVPYTRNLSEETS